VGAPIKFSLSRRFISKSAENHLAKPCAHEQINEASTGQFLYQLITKN